MKKYRCPKCHNSSTTSYCCECETNIPMSCAFDDESDFCTIRKSYSKHTEKPSGNYEKMFLLEYLNPDIAGIVSSTMLNEEEHEKYMNGFIIRRIVTVIAFVIFAVFVFNRV